MTKEMPLPEGIDEKAAAWLQDTHLKALGLISEAEDLQQAGVFVFLRGGSSLTKEVKTTMIASVSPADLRAVLREVSKALAESIGPLIAAQIAAEAVADGVRDSLANANFSDGTEWPDEIKEGS